MKKEMFGDYIDIFFFYFRRIIEASFRQKDDLLEVIYWVAIQPSQL